jgi:hypothetical protein
LDKQTITVPVRDSLQSIEDALNQTIFRNPTIAIDEEKGNHDKEALIIH